MSTAITRVDATFKNIPGKLSVTETHIAWVPDVTGTMDRQQQNLSRVINLLASKATGKKVSLKLVFKDDLPAGGLLFSFTSAAAAADRQTVQDRLIPHVTSNKNAAGGVGAVPGTPGAPAGVQGSMPAPVPSTATAAVVSQVGAAAASTGAGADGTPNAAKRRKLDTGAADSPGAGPSTPGTPGSMVAMTPEQQAARKLETKLKMKVLAKNPNLRTLHKELVRGQQISEREFWEGREALLEAERLAQSLKPGRPSRLLDDRFDLDTSRNKSSSSGGGTGVGVKQKESGPMVLNITKELTREIFEEFPVVQDAYARHVPGISESEFWTRYFTSQLWEQHRASVRKATNEDVNRKKDDIFDLYLEDPDWGIEPRKEAEELVGRVIDLAATEQDHGDSDTVRDHTMQAGRERSSLPLIRRFNEHSNKLLRRSGGEKSSLSSSFLPDDANIYDEIDLEDLHGPAQANTIALDVRDADADEGPGRSSMAKGILPGRSDEDLLQLATAQSADITTWHLDFSGVSLQNPLVTGQFTDKLDTRDVDEATRKQAEVFNLQRLGQRYAMNTVKDMHLASNAENMVYPDLPVELLDSMRTCHNAATEFLRQYWSAVLPTPPAALGAGTPSQSESAKAAKAERMATYLRGMEGKLEAVVQLGVAVGVDPGRIRAALAPTFGAVAVGLQKEERRLRAIQAKAGAGRAAGAGRVVSGNGRA